MTGTVPPATPGRPAGAPWHLAEARDYLGIPERTFRKLTSAGTVRTIKIGTKKMVPDAEVRRVAADGA